MLNDGTMEGSSIFVFLIFFFVSLFREGGKLVDEDGLDHWWSLEIVSFFFFLRRMESF